MKKEKGLSQKKEAAPFRFELINVCCIQENTRLIIE
jgi:hypothetical protein